MVVARGRMGGREGGREGGGSENGEDGGRRMGGREGRRMGGREGEREREIGRSKPYHSATGGCTAVATPCGGQVEQGGMP